MCTSGLQLQSQQIKLAASGIVGLFTAGLVQLAVAPHSLANMVTVVLITVPNADLECLSSLACVSNLTSLTAHQPTNFVNSLAKPHNLLHLCITDATCDMSHMQQVSARILFNIDSTLHHVILPSSTSLVRLQHLRCVDIVDAGHNMAVHTFERGNLKASQELNDSEFGSCYPSRDLAKIPAPSEVPQIVLHVM